MKQKAFFITGTDTGIGKTFYSCKLLQALNALGCSTVAMKPVAAGAVEEQDILKNKDAIKLQQAASIEISYQEVNPYCFPSAVSPHIAASDTGSNINLEYVYDQFLKLCGKADVLLVEGVGGWQVPLNDTQTVADLVARLQIPVVMVVGMRLGCINHALLTASSIQQSSVPFAGWIANILEPDMQALRENILTLQQKISAPLLDVIQYQADNTSQNTDSVETQWLLNQLSKNI